ncbi:SDR family NAD(P)-dependent oxidoreductase [Streptomyces sp. NEAU-Y11]|uniref:SDR family NAD(P)-dependent oxidoreductase n=1 Tax=Streptomyces cucumeris TaxID=2962890 RepID=UPI0020C91AB6|nr:SDR family NAD(P)-dependent oxidoreductase [Streptomyces sp. NEAU-Y11]MCP9210517.1 SDR family NAD(P)-dependent oxidoreductase [Streptomyces sp. NEAU-Y11]
MRIAGSTVLLTGALGGIGQAIARDLAGKGAKLVLSGRRADTLEALADELGARAVTADLADPDQVDHLAQAAHDTDILIANAALPATGELLDYTPEQIDRALTVNLRAPIMLSRALAPRMVEQGRGHIVHVGSISGKAATKYSSLYSAAKFGLRGFALSLRQDLHGTGVGVSVVQPGAVRDVGMFAATGATPPTGVRMVSPAQVVSGVVRAVERDLCEVNVAPVELRVLSALAGQFPGFAEKAQRGSSAERTLNEVVAAHRDRR